MVPASYAAFKKAVRLHLKGFRNKRLSTDDFDRLTAGLLADRSLGMADSLYGRYGCVYVNKISDYSFQVLGFQFNTFAAGAFGPERARFCTPILLTVTVHGSHPYLNHNLRDSLTSLDEFYLGQHYSGSKGAACDREAFARHIQDLMLAPKAQTRSRRVVWQLMKMNHICHHLSETLAYICGALTQFWTTRQSLFLLASGSQYHPKASKLTIDIIDEFTEDRMSSRFEVPHYRLIEGDSEALQEGHEHILWRVDYRNDRQWFYLPSGYQKVLKTVQGGHVNAITTQSVVEHVMLDYFQRQNAFVVSNTFQILEHLSRGIWAKAHGPKDEGGRFMKLASSCLGHYPEKNLEEVLARQESRFETFAGEYAYANFFRAPVLD